MSPDIYSLTLGQVAELERMAEKSATNLINQIEASKERSLQRLIYGLDIRHVGERYAKILARHFRSIENLRKATVEELDAIHEIGLAGCRKRLQLDDQRAKPRFDRTLEISGRENGNRRIAGERERKFRGKNFRSNGKTRNFDARRSREID
jgi:DNA ligase (NAD+)